jgi:hypothetical protein
MLFALGQHFLDAVQSFCAKVAQNGYLPTNCGFLPTDIMEESFGNSCKKWAQI